MSETTTNQPGRERPARPQAVLSVLSRERLSPHTVRITASGPGFEALRMNEFTDKYAKMLFVDPALGLTPPYDLAALRASLPPGRLPVTRTYTLRRADPARQQLTIDFVVHGDEVVWLHRPHPGREPGLLAGAVAAGPWLPGRADVFAHGERESMKAIRAALKPLLGAGDQISLSGYWAAGRTEDVFQSEKRQPIGQI